MVKKGSGEFKRELLKLAKIDRLGEVPGKMDFDLISYTTLADKSIKVVGKCKKCKETINQLDLGGHCGCCGGKFHMKCAQDPILRGPWHCSMCK